MNTELQRRSLDMRTKDFTRHTLGGFTLAEAMMATVVLGIAAAGVLLPFASGARVRAEGTRRTLGAKLAGDLIEQIVNTPFEQIVINYHGYSEPQGQLKDSAGIIFTDPAYANFSRDASCAYVYVPQQGGTYQANFVRITVGVYYRGRPIASIKRLISK